MSSEPILDIQLADQFFAVSAPKDQAELREVLREFVADATPRFALLRPASAPEEDGARAVRELHQLRGAVANFGLAAAAARLLALERDWTKAPAAVRMRELLAAETEVQEGVRRLCTRYPYMA